MRSCRASGNRRRARDVGPDVSDWARVLVVIVSTTVLVSCTSGGHGSTAASTASTAAPGPSSSTTAAQAAVCDSTAPADVPVHQRDGTQTTMVPGRPDRLLGCRYHGLNQPEPVRTLASSAALPAGELAALVNAVRIPPPGSPVPNCPADFGETYVLRFGYADGTDLVVTVGRGGCRVVSNGDLHGWPAGAELIGRLQAALGGDPGP